MATCKAVVTSRGYLSPRIAVLEHQIPGTPADVRDAPLYELLHQTTPIVERRYEVHRCLCETIPLELAGPSAGGIRMAPNVIPIPLLRVKHRSDDAAIR